MGKVVILDENTANKIAAGEVIERPASVIKELVENSIDAGATSITVDIRNGGIPYIKVTDNGSGIAEDDTLLVFERHSTSKIRSADDLESITTMGFRGEALASIASVSTVELTTRTQDNDYGIYVKVQGGNLIDTHQIGCPVGTTFVIRDLFYNTPARYKFLKKDSTEAGYVSDVMNRIALSKPDISLKFTSNGSTVLHTPGNNDLLSVIFSIYGKDVARQVVEVDYEDNNIKVYGYVGKPEIARSNRNHQSFFINGRYIKCKLAAAALDEAYKTLLMKNKFPFSVLHMEINPMFVDINVHPSKLEARFANEQQVFSCIYHAVNNALLKGNNLTRSIQYADKKDNYFKFENVSIAKDHYVQQKIDTNLHNENKEVKKHDEYSKSKETIYKENSVRTGIIEDKNLKSDKADIISDKTDYHFGKDEKYLNNIKLKSSSEDVEHVSVNSAAEINEGNICKQENIKEESKTEDKDTEKSTDNVSNESLKESVSDGTTKSQSIRYLLENTKIIGQVFSTYILLEHLDELILIDQHAAHERIMFEEIKAKYEKQEPAAQYLLSPVVIELTHQELKFLEENKEFFNKTGFIFDNFGNNSIILRTTPGISENANIKSDFLEILDKIQGSFKIKNESEIDEAIYTIACKAAVKANSKLDDLEIKALLKRLSMLENPYTCPHGRPVMINITKREFEKMFKRIV